MSRLLPLVRVAALISLLASAAGRQRRVPLPTIRRAFYSLVLVVSLLAPPAAAQTSPSSGVGSVPTVLATVRIGTAPTGVAVNPKTNRVYVSDTIANKLSVADGTTNVVLASTLVGRLQLA